MICFLTVRATRWNIKHPILKNEHLTNLKHPQSSMEPLNRRELDDCRSSVNKICKKICNQQGQAPIQRQHLAKDGEGAPRKTCTSILVRCFIFHNLATFEDQGMQICISILKGNKIMKSKAPNLEGLLQTLASL